MSPTATHNVIIADRSETGAIAVASILTSCPLADDYVSTWRRSKGEFFVFIAEHDSRRFGGIAALNLDELLSATLPALFAEHLLANTSAEFDIFVDDGVATSVYDGVARLQIAAAVDAARPHDRSDPPLKVRNHIRSEHDATLEMTRSERERSIRYLCRMWDESHVPDSAHSPKYSSFEGWLRANGYSHYLAATLKGSPDLDAEAWFNDEISHIARARR